MFCTHCGAQNDDNAWKCNNCGKPLHEAAPQTMAQTAQFPNYLVQAILCTLFCCLPFGIVGIVYASHVNSKLAVGDLAGAQIASRKAKTWCWVSFGVGLSVYILGFMLGIIGEIFSNLGG